MSLIKFADYLSRRGREVPQIRSFWQNNFLLPEKYAKTQCQIKLTFQSQNPLNIKVVLEGKNECYIPDAFQPSQTPRSRVLPISPRFLTNIIEYLSSQRPVDWCLFDQNWPKNRPLHFQIFQILNATNRPLLIWCKIICWLNVYLMCNIVQDSAR